MGIADKPEFLIEWNEKAIEIAEQSSSERVQGWLGSLLNNLTDCLILKRVNCTFYI